MNGYPFAGGYDGSSMEQGDQSGASNLMMMGQDGMSGSFGGQSLEDIVNQNSRAIRRQSLPHQYVGSPDNSMDASMRRISMIDYSGGSLAGQLGNFQFAPSNRMDQRGPSSHNEPPAHRNSSQHRRQSEADLAINTNFANAHAYNNGVISSSSYQSPAHPQSGFDMAMDSPYLDPNADMQMDFSAGQSAGGISAGDMQHMNLFAQPQFAQSMMHSPITGSHGMPHAEQGSSQTLAASTGVPPPYSGPSGSSNSAVELVSQNHGPRMQDMSARQPSGGVTPVSAGPTNHPNLNFQQQPQHSLTSTRQDHPVSISGQVFDGVNGPVPIDTKSYNPNNQGFNWDVGEGGWPSTMIGKPHMQTTYKNAYSATGFDMLGVLMRVATRRDPEINIGAVDLSCAFVVCDAEKDDFPIVYCSDNFERLTGYTRHMILGRNCRFLQSPDGNVEPGIRRKYVDDDSVLYLKNMVNVRREAQISLINYRRGGQPFMNLLTIIPVTWETEQVKFFVGFQVDLVEQPNAVTSQNPDGSYSINYQRGMTIPRYVLQAPDNTQKADLGQTVPRDDVSAILSSYGSADSDYAKRVWDKVLLENTDDVVHVLSLKGLFQWVSPSSTRVLEYEPSELIGTALSSVCHPSDIVPVTRELKDTSNGASVNVVFRIRRKLSGYMWFEGHGALHTEQGKGRKSIILVGRERPVYTLGRSEIVSAGGLGDNELWTKMSTSGMFLYVSSNVRQLLDRQPDELVGTSIQNLMRAESKGDFGRILEHARTGKKASAKHELINRRGQVMSAHTTLYPGDATEGSKPTFIVAQTRLIKFQRSVPTSSRPHLYPKLDRPSSESVQSGGTPIQPVASVTSRGSSEQTPTTMASPQYLTTDSSAATYSGHQGLEIGHQDVSLVSEDNLFDELKPTKSSSWQYEIRQLEKRNRLLAEEVQSLTAAKKKRKRRKGKDQQKDCANCHTRVTPEWRRGPSGQRDLCNSCGLRWAKLNGRVSPRTSSQHSAGGASDTAGKPASPLHAGGQSAIKQESPGQPQQFASTSTTPGAEPREVPTTSSHAASMEGASGVPDRIDESMEEND